MSLDKSKEDLVAYLDGELPEDAVSEVEKSLVEDATVRRDVEQLAKTYDLLDLLPNSRASDGFAEKTLTLIRAGGQTPASEPIDGSDATGRSSKLPRMAIQWSIRAAAFTGLMLAANAGFNGSFRQNSEPIDELLTELPLIKRLDEYQEIGNVQVLKSLSESGLLDERDQTPQD